MNNRQPKFPNNKKEISIIIPTWNESGNIIRLVKRLSKALNALKYELIFIDDHSTDNTVTKINSLSKNYPIRVYLKQGKKGKAFSILEGAAYANSKYIAMIDSDLQYPPEAIPEMFEKVIQKETGVVVANRKSNKESVKRRFMSRTFNFFFGKLLHNFDCDVQSGLKLFKKQIIENIEHKDVSPWTLDLILLQTAQNLGYKIKTTDINFDKRVYGKSKINTVKSSIEIASRAVLLKFKSKKIFTVAPKKNRLMVGAGVIYNREKLITHSTLHYKSSALETFHLWQKLFLTASVLVIAAGFIINPLFSAVSLLGFITFIYFADVIFNFYLIFKSLHFPPELAIPKSQINKLKDSTLPVYSILCPLYKESQILPHFVTSIQNLDWPKNKLDVLLLLEENDHETISLAKSMNLPKYFRIIIVPDSQPKTKPKACNYGLNFAKGEYLVIYDAEDQPERDQLKKAYLVFKNSQENVVCLQAKLNYFNPGQNLLTKLFTAEYSLWFDTILPGLQSINTTIPLGGTSNHFKSEILKDLKGWDSFNVTEDCDLGVRLFKQGYKTAIIDSTTYEEANSNLKNWLRQRSRWIKGYMQTYLVHTKNPIVFVKEHKLTHSLIFQLIIGARITFMLINPILWLTTISYFVFYDYTSGIIEALYPTIVFYFAVFSLIIGNFAYIYNYMIGCAKRGHWDLIKFVFLIPFYWILTSVAALIAFYQLFAKPHYWEKTVHGLHLKPIQNNALDIAEEAVSIKDSSLVSGVFSFPKNIKSAFLDYKGKIYFGSVVLIGSTIASHFLNFLTSAFLGRNLTFEEFGTFSLFTSFAFLLTIPFGSLTATITHQTAFIYGKYSKQKAQEFINTLNRPILFLSLLITFLYLIVTPFLVDVFQVDTIIPFLLFAPSLFSGLLYSHLSGLLRGTLSFSSVGIITFLSIFIKLLGAYFLIQANFENLVVSILTISSIVELCVALAFVPRLQFKSKINFKEVKFDKAFFVTSTLVGISTISFLGLDTILAKSLLSPSEAGQYGLLSLVGKMTYFLSSLFFPFLLPVVSKNLGEGKSSKKAFTILFSITLILCVFSFIALGVFGNLLVPLLLGPKAWSIVPLLPTFMIAIGVFTLTRPIVFFYQAQKNYSFAIAGFITSIFQILLVLLFHKNISEFVNILLIVSLANLIVISALYLLQRYLNAAYSNLKDFYQLIFTPFNLRYTYPSTNGLRILIFNWRDTEHKWAGGAENYIFELSKRWIKAGHQVTIFCGNDAQSARHERINGIHIIRRGGFVTVYIWAFLYYMFRLRGVFDLVIDSENGIPFFTPLYVRKPKFLLIHHIHQEVFRERLKFPLSQIAMLLEAKLMPLVYKNQKIITVSESSKNQILKLGLSNSKDIDIVNPGVSEQSFCQTKKTKYPSILYLGRLKHHKKVDVAIRAFKEVVKQFPDAYFTIAGDGESLETLKNLTKKLNLEKNIIFLGKVSEKIKLQLYSESWIFVQPSMIEGWGITVIEANAAKMPVVASNVNGLQDSVLDKVTGLLVKPDSVEGFSEAIKHLIKHRRIRSNMAREAFKWSKLHTWDEKSERFLNIIVQEAFNGKYYLEGKLALYESRINK